MERLEDRLKLLEGLVKQLCPDLNTLHGLIYPHDPEYAEQLTNITTPTSNSSDPHIIHPSCASSTADLVAKETVLDLIHKVVSISLGSQDDPFRDDDKDYSTISEQMKSLSVQPEGGRFWGNSSGALLMEAAISMKNKHLNSFQAEQRALQDSKPLFWKRLPWDKDIRPAVEYIFPSTNLIIKLTDAYFEHVNIFYPLLHRPTFEQVCAVGSRCLENVDEQTLVDGVDSDFTAGWKWYKQVQVVKPNLVDRPTLYDLQLYCLAIEFLFVTCGPQNNWLLSGFGIRVAQDVGAHRRRVPRDKLTVEDELWKRAFWVLVAKDRMISLAIGRPCAILDDYFDLDMPIECDDEYWENEDPRQRFKQPAGVPSTVTAFNQHLRLTKIMAFSMSTIYSIQTKFWEFILQEWEKHVVAELDSALNNWLNSLPEYLRWDPNRVDNRFFKLSGFLITHYHYVQMLIHRPYIGTNGRPSQLAFPSLAICNTAARSCALVLEQQMKRFVIVYPYMQLCCTSTMIVLLLNAWGSKRGGVPDPKVMKYFKMCLDVLKKAEGLSYCAGLVMDLFGDLATTDNESIRPEGDKNKMPPFSSTTGYPSESNTGRMGNVPALPLSTQDSVFTFDQLDTAPQEMYGCAGSQISYPPAQLSDMFGGQFHDELCSSNFSHSNHDMQSNQFRSVDQVPNQNLFPSTQAFSSGPGSSTYPSSHIMVPSQDISSNDDSYNTVESEQVLFENVLPPYFNPKALISDQQMPVDSNAMAMWFNAPSSFEPDEWRSFLANFVELTNELNSDD